MATGIKILITSDLWHTLYSTFTSVKIKGCQCDQRFNQFSAFAHTHQHWLFQQTNQLLSLSGCQFRIL